MCAKMTHIEQIFKKNSIENRINNTKPTYYLHKHSISQLVYEV